MRRSAGLTVVEVLTIVVGVVVLVAAFIPLWRTHELRSQRHRALEMLQAIQAAQDRHFSRHALYADLAELDLEPAPAGFSLALTRGADRLSYVATVRIAESAGNTADPRCASMSIDQHGRQSSVDESGNDSSGDCLYRR